MHFYIVKANVITKAMDVAKVMGADSHTAWLRWTSAFAYATEGHDNCCGKHRFGFPANELLLKTRNWPLVETLPTKLLWERSRVTRLLMAPNSSGMCPERWFLERFNMLRTFKYSIPFGISPTSSLQLKSIDISEVQRETEFGIKPLKLLLLMLNFVNLGKSNASPESSPDEQFLGKYDLLL